jgi:hypothetical protein
MPDDLRNLEMIAANMRDGVRRYAATLRADLGANMASLAMFGRVVAGNFDRENHSALSVLLVDAVDLPSLRRLADHGEILGKDSIAAPLVMTPKYIRASLDTFPLELLEIQQRHATLLGPDPFSDLVFEQSYIRLQCERELKRVLMAMRQALLASGGREAFIEPFERDAADTLLRTLHGILWLRGEREPMAVGQIVDHAERQFGRKLPGLRIAIDDNAHLGWPEFDELYREVEWLGETVNAV